MGLGEGVAEGVGELLRIEVATGDGWGVAEGEDVAVGLAVSVRVGVAAPVGVRLPLAVRLGKPMLPDVP